MRIRHFALVAVLASFFVTSVAYAVWPVALSWIGSGLTSARIYFQTPMGRSTLKSLNLHAAVAGLVFATPGSTPRPDGSEPAAFTVNLVELPQRQNPDPERYDDAPPGQIDPIPKASYDLFEGLEQSPSDLNQVIDQLGGSGWKKYAARTGGGVIEYFTRTWPVGHRPGAVGTSTSAIPKYLPEDERFSRQLNRKVDSGDCGKSAEDSPNCEYISLYRHSEYPQCPTGYRDAGGSVCELVDSSVVPKPPKTVPCEVVYADGSMGFDWANPECNTVVDGGYIQTISENEVQLDDAESRVTVGCTGAGCNIVETSKTDGTWTQYTLGKPDSGGYRQVESIQAGTGEPPTGGGGNGGNGGGGMDCTPGDPCYVNVDDSGFDGMATGLESLEDAEQAHFEKMMDGAEGVAFNDTHGLEWDWVPDLPSSSCQTIQFGIEPYYVEIDLCEKFKVFRDVLGWLLYLYTTIYILDLFLDSAYPQYYGRGRSSKRS